MYPAFLNEIILTFWPQLSGKHLSQVLFWLLKPDIDIRTIRFIAGELCQLYLRISQFCHLFWVKSYCLSAYDDSHQINENVSIIGGFQIYLAICSQNKYLSIHLNFNRQCYSACEPMIILFLYATLGIGPNKIWNNTLLIFLEYIELFFFSY